MSSELTSQAIAHYEQAKLTDNVELLLSYMYLFSALDTEFLFIPQWARTLHESIMNVSVTFEKPADIWDIDMSIDVLTLDIDERNTLREIVASTIQYVEGFQASSN